MLNVVKSGDKDYWLSTNGVDSVSFIKQAVPPLGTLNRGIMYELNDGNLYYNGTQLNGGGGSGDVSGPGASTVDSFALFDDLTGTSIKSTTQKLRDQGTYGLRITGDNGGFETTLIYADDVNVGMGIDVFGSTLTTGNSNVAIGNNSMTAATSAQFNVAVGNSALNGIDDGSDNVAIGHLAMQNGLTAEANIAIGTQALRACDNVGNIAIGFLAAPAITSGARNTIVGTQSAESLETGSFNTIIGNESLKDLIAGNRNTSIGSNTLRALQTGDDNVCVGFEAMRNCVNAGSNVAIGKAALKACNSIGNIAIGWETAPTITFGDYNVIIGTESAGLLTTGSRNTIVGDGSLAILTTGNDNVCIGRDCANAYTGAESNNIIIGNSVTGVVGESNRIRIGNTQPAIYLSNRHLLNDTSGNMLLGGYSLTEPTGTNNVCVGKNSLIGAAGNFVNSNAVVGQASLSSLTGGDNNTCMGSASLRFLLSGNSNVVVGNASANNYTGAESNNIVIGGSVSGNTGESNTIRVGSTQTRAFVAGIRGVTTGVADAIPVLIDSNGQLGTVSSSIKYKENVEKLVNSEVLYSLDPVEFNYIGQDKRTIGLIAEEVEAVYPEMCIYDTDGSLLTVDYNRLSILLLSEVKKLKDLITK